MMRTDRRYLSRFGLKTLLGVVVFASAPCAWLASVASEHAKEQRAIKELSELHRIVADNEPITVGAQGGFVELESAWSGPGLLRPLSHLLPNCERVVGVHFVMEHVDDRTTKVLAEFKQLREVFLQDVPGAKAISLVIRRNAPACKVGIHPEWEVTLPPDRRSQGPRTKGT